MDDTQIDRQLADIFFIESEEMLDEASLALLKAEEAGNLQPMINQVFRAIHSIKGGAQSLGFEQLSEVAHHMEDFLVPLRSDDSTIDDHTVSLILESMDAIAMQLSACQFGTEPADCTTLLTRLNQATTQSTCALKDINCKEHSLSSAEIVELPLGSRLVYVAFTVDLSVSMPSVTAFIFLEQLRQCGRILYSNPDSNNMGMTVAGETFKQTVVFQTDMCNAEIKQTAYCVGDICELEVAEIDNSVFSKAAKPTKEEIDYFNILVRKIREMLYFQVTDKLALTKSVRQIADWGATSRGAASWFQGGLPAWQRMTSLLDDMVALVEGLESSDKNKTTVARLLRVLWEAVYHALCNHTYFYSLAVSDILEGNAMSVLNQFEAKAVDVQVVSIDLSEWVALEIDHLNALADIRDKFAEKGWIVWLLSEGEHTRRHLNVLEVAERFVGAFEFHASIYSAVTVPNKISVKFYPRS